jgi:hypothetical protein
VVLERGNATCTDWRDIDIQKADDSTQQELERLVPMYQDLAKVHLLQTLVSRILVDMVFNAYFVGLSPEQTQLFGQMEATLSSLGMPILNASPVERP